MKNVLVPNTLKLSPLEKKVFIIIERQKAIHNWMIAEMLFKKSKIKSKSASNSVTSAVRQINRKLEKLESCLRICGKGTGRGGKVLYLDFIKDPRG